MAPVVPVTFTGFQSVPTRPHRVSFTNFMHLITLAAIIYYTLIHGRLSAIYDKTKAISREEKSINSINLKKLRKMKKNQQKK